MKDLKNKLVLVTGAGSGIGRLMSLEFAAQGSDLVLWDIRLDLIEETKELVLKSGKARSDVKIEVQQCDLSKKDAIYAASDELLKNHPQGVDVLVNNAGIVSGKPFLEVDDAMVERTMAVNSMAHMWLAKKLLPPMISKNSGHIVTIASAAGLNGVAGLADYCASKFAAVGFDESLRLELQKLQKDVKTTVVCPFYINTGMFDGVKLTFPTSLLMPILEPQYVVDQIIKAVKNDTPVLYLPRMLYYVQMIKVLVPTWVSDRLNRVLGISSSMDEFKGRGKDWGTALPDASKKTN